MTAPVVSRFDVVTSVTDIGDGWHVIDVRCPCRTTTARRPPDSDALLADVIEEARALHAQAAPGCPHRERR
jgi:hypothetical protein